MRQLTVKVPEHQRQHATALAEEFEASNVSVLDATDGDGPHALLVASVSNRRVGPFVRRLQDLDEVEVTFQPAGVLTMRRPWDTLNDQVADPAARSPLEVYLGGVQSIGNWKGFLSYAALAGVIVWAALFLNVVFLQVAAMLIAPFAGPAMITALGTASGDGQMVGRGVARYASGIAVTVATAAALHALFGTGTVSQDMIQTSKISSLAVVLPLAAGAAGALNLSQPERSSLVPGAATGVLVAAALAPPAGLLGMAAVMGEWDMTRSAAFLLALQLSGINLTGALVFRLFGLQPDTRLGSGRGAVVWAGLAVSAMVLAALVAWQFSDSPGLQHTTVERKAEDLVSQAAEDRDQVELVRVDADFTRPDIAGQETLLVSLWLQHTGPGDVPADLASSLAASVGNALRDELDVVPLVDVTILQPPS